MHSYDSKIPAFVEAARKVAAYGLVQCSSGNLSWRVGPDIALLSASRSWLAELTAGQVAVCEINTGQCLNKVTPTCEWVFHLGILKHRPEMNVVLHFQSPYATAVACGTPEKHDFNMTIEVPVYIGRPKAVPYSPPGSKKLAQAAIEVFKDKQTHLAILNNHGLVTVGKDINDAIQKAVFFEMTCRILLTNPDAKPLALEEVERLHKSAQA
jgi:ribulose-5-phosphate 4-epimerase/fuculose-1-phosphate aldolase